MVFGMIRFSFAVGLVRTDTVYYSAHAVQRMSAAPYRRLASGGAAEQAFILLKHEETIMLPQ